MAHGTTRRRHRYRLAGDVAHGQRGLMERATARRRHRYPRGLTAVAALVLAAGVWGSAPPATANDEATFVDTYNAAVAARKAAAKAGYEWRDTKKLLRQARKLAEKGEFEKAVALATRAKRQGELGLMQAEEQEAVWREAVVK